MSLSDNYIGGVGLPPEYHGETHALKHNDKVLSQWIVNKKTYETEITVLEGGTITVDGNKITITWEKK